MVSLLVSNQFKIIPIIAIDFSTKPRIDLLQKICRFYFNITKILIFGYGSINGVFAFNKNIKNPFVDNDPESIERLFDQIQVRPGPATIQPIIRMANLLGGN
jgi:hypothetical protein